MNREQGITLGQACILQLWILNKSKRDGSGLLTDS